MSYIYSTKKILILFCLDNYFGKTTKIPTHYIFHLYNVNVSNIISKINNPKSAL